MNAGAYVGRVAGLAVALGVGAAVAALPGVASAEPASEQSESSESSESTSSSPGPNTGPASDPSQDRNQDPKAEPNVEPGSDPDSSPKRRPTTDGNVTTVGNGRTPSSARATVHDDEEQDTKEQDTEEQEPADTEPTSPRDDEPQDSAAPMRLMSAPEPQEQDSDAVDHPTAPPDSPVDWMLAGAARRELADAPITVDPVVGLVDGVVTGSVNATGGGNPLTYSPIGAPSAGGKLTLDAAGNFTFLPDGSIVATRGVERFSIQVAERTALIAALERVPLASSIVQPIVALLRQIPILGTALQPLIGYAVVVPIEVDVAALAPGGAPIAFTTRIVSFDGTSISTNFFPALGLPAGITAPTLLLGPGFADPGDTNPTSSWSNQYGVPGIAPLRADGYNVVTWDPRGVGASGGVLHLNNPLFEGLDAKAIVDWVASRPEAVLDAAGDPRLGMVGGSYGGGIQLITAAIDQRVDAIAPSITWNSLLDSLYPNQAFKTAYSLLLTLDLLTSGVRAIPDIYAGTVTGSLLGVLTPEQQAVLASSGPGLLVGDITAPTLLIQGTVDPLFPLRQAVVNAQLFEANGVPVKMIWFCGGHGACLTSLNDGALIADRTMAWLDRYVKGNEDADTGATFEWVNQYGQNFSSDVLPSDPAFYGAPLTVSGTGGVLPLLPIGGSGPQDIVPLPLSLALASRADTAIDVPIPAPATTVQLVGAPALTFTYSGVGTSRFVYAQLVDDQTGLVLGNLVTPVPVTLDGRSHTVAVAMEHVAHTLAPGQSLTLQITGSSVAYANLGTLGVMNVSDVSVALPTAAAVSAARLDEFVA